MIKIVCLVLVAACVFVASEVSKPSDEKLFRQFIVDYGRVYKSEDEYNTRLSNFKKNLKRIDELNSMPGQGAVFAVNKFSDLSVDEFSAMYLLPPFDPNDTCIWPYHKVAKVSKQDTMKIPAYFDWTSKGVVTPVKNQQQCGSCWTFSTTGNIEGQWALYSPQKNLQGLSEQWIVDCSTSCLVSEPTLCNSGCGGGLPWLAYEDIITNKGLPAESAYPYTAEDGTCQSGMTNVAHISNWTAASTDPTEIITLMYNQGPLSITMNADMLMSYSTGIITGSPDDCPNDESDHAILLVGYGSNYTVPYWIVKNSWGTDWGMDGYFMIESDNGLCGINACVTTTLYS